MNSTRLERSKRRKARQKLKKKTGDKKQKQKQNINNTLHLQQRVSFERIGFAQDGSGVRLETVFGTIVSSTQQEQEQEGEIEIVYLIKLDDLYEKRPLNNSSSLFQCPEIIELPESQFLNLKFISDS